MFLELKGMNGKVLTKGLFLYLCVSIYSILYCVREIKRKIIMCKSKGDIPLENGIVRTRNHLHQRFFASNNYCF